MLTLRGKISEGEGKQKRAKEKETGIGLSAHSRASEPATLKISEVFISLEHKGQISFSLELNSPCT